MNLVGYFIGIAMWCLIGYVVHSYKAKLFCLIPSLILAVLATKQFITSRRAKKAAEERIVD